MFKLQICYQLHKDTTPFSIAFGKCAITIRRQIRHFVIEQNSLLTRALEGGKKCPPLRFFADSGKTAARSAVFFQYLLTIELDTWCKNFNPMSPKVRSPGQVKVKNGFLTLRLRSGHTRYPIGFKFSAFHKVRYLQLVYLEFFISVTRGQVNFVTSPL